MIALEDQMPWHESAVQQLNLLAADFARGRPQVCADNTAKLRLEAKAETLANLIRWTKTPKDLEKVLAAWTEMKAATGLEQDFDVTEHLEQMRIVVEHMKDSTIALVTGRGELILRQPSAAMSEVKFDAEMSKAMKFAEANQVVVWWYHNGVRVSTDWAQSPGGAWARLTEVSAEMAS